MKTLGIVVFVMLCLVALTPAVTAWESQQIYEFQGEEEPSGISLAAHSTTGAVSVVTGTQDGFPWHNITTFTTKDGASTWSERVVEELNDDYLASGSVGGMTSSKQGFAFCRTYVRTDEAASNPQLEGNTGAGIFYTEDPEDGWSERELRVSPVWATPCDLGLPKHGWREPSNPSMMMVNEPEGFDANQSVWFQMFERDCFSVSEDCYRAGPVAMAGEFQVGVSMYQYLVLPGRIDGPGHSPDEVVSYLQAPKETGSFLEKVWSGGKRALEGAFAGVHWARSFGKEEFGKECYAVCLDIEQSATRTSPIYDDQSLFVSSGFGEEPVESYQVNIGWFSFLDDTRKRPTFGTWDDDVHPVHQEQVASSAGFNFAAADTAYLRDDSGIVMWNDRNLDKVRFRTVSMDGPGATKDAFDHESDITWMKVTGLAGDTGIAQFGGVFVDKEGNITYFETRDNGRSWTKEIVAEDSRTTTTAVDFHWRTDIAYDGNRNQIHIGYANADGYNIVTETYIEKMPEVNVRQFKAHETNADDIFEDDDSVTGMLASSMGMNEEGAGYLVFVVLFLLGVVIAAALSNKSTIGVVGGGGLATVASVGFGLITYWLLFPILLLYVGTKKIIEDKG